MIPLFDKNRAKHFPFITILFILICIAEYIFQVFFLKDPDMYIYKYSFIPSKIPNILESYRFITHIFLHGSIMHLLGNMLFLWVFGDNVEDKLGHLRFVEFYIFAGIAAALFQAGIAIITNSANIPLIGASGAISGIMGAYLLLFPKAPILTLIPFAIIYVPAWVYIIIWFVIQCFSAFINTGDNVAYFAHMGGFIIGVIYTWKFKRKH